MDPVFQPEKRDCGTWVVKGVKVSAGGSLSELRAGHLPAEKELLVAVAAAEPVEKVTLGLAPLLVMNPVALCSCLEKHPETCHTASESETETAAAVASQKLAAAAAAEAVAAEFAAAVEAAVAEFVVAAAVAEAVVAEFVAAVAEAAVAEFVAAVAAAGFAAFGSVVGAYRTLWL